MSLTTGDHKHHIQLEQVQEQTSLALHHAQAQIAQEINAIKSLTVKNRFPAWKL
jgi:hypothetical protein